MASFNKFFFCASIALTGCDNSTEFSGAASNKNFAQQTGTPTQTNTEVSGGLSSGTNDPAPPLGEELGKDLAQGQTPPYKEVIFKGNDETPTEAPQPTPKGENSDQNSDALFTQEFNVDLASIKRPVDLIFAIDTSGSMNDEKNKVTQNIQALTKTFAQLGDTFDYKMWFVGQNLQITDLNPAKITMINKPVGSTDALNVLNNLFIGQIPNPSPLRENTLKAIIVITDDNATIGVPAFNKTIGENKFFKDKTSFFGFIWIDNVSVPTTSCTRANHGKVYLDLASAPATRGTVYDLCTPNWTILFEDLGKKIVTKTLVLEYALSKKADPKLPLQVFVGGSQVESSRYRYDATKNSLIFSEGKAPLPGTKITVKYLPL